MYATSHKRPFSYHLLGVSDHYCDESVSRGRETGTKGREAGTKGRRTGTIGTRERETLWTRPNRLLGPGNESPPCVDMAGTSDPFSRCVIVRD